MTIIVKNSVQTEKDMNKVIKYVRPKNRDT